MTGGSVDGVSATDNASITVSGGVITEDLLNGFNVYENGVIYIVGSNFQVNGQPISFGDKLSNYGLSGTISGVLTDGSSFNNTFVIHNTGNFAGTADIVVIPEPATLSLLAIGALFSRKRK